ncbi:MAG: hypothetical protein HYR74_08980 [Candidatus Eisenbacteria bacterium]|nr:hypothetical protein [Candidatus Eisenbacteria bacterium]
MSSTIRSSLQSGLSILRIVGWIVGTVWLGAAVVWKACRFLARAPQVFARQARCPRGHAVEVYGAFACGKCGAAFEGHAFDPCPICGAKAHFIACPTCHLAIRDPLR